MKPTLSLGFTYNVRHVKPSLTDERAMEEADFDEPKTIEDIIQALESLGTQVFPVEANEHAYQKLQKLSGKIDLVFNLAEGIRGLDRESQIPAMLEMLGIPYTGGSPLSYALGLDKARCKEVLSYHGIRTPGWQVLRSVGELEKLKLQYPILVKPLREGSSKGIFADNLVENRKKLELVLARTTNDYHQPALLEEYLPGREFTVGLIGSEPEVLPIIEVTFNDLPDHLPKFEHYESKWLYDVPQEGKDPLVCPAKIPEDLAAELREMSLEIFDLLEVKDFARLDFRLDHQGRPSFIEINCPPGITPDPMANSRLPRAARAAGYSYTDLLTVIMSSACERYQIKAGSKWGRALKSVEKSSPKVPAKRLKPQ